MQTCAMKNNVHHKDKRTRHSRAYITCTRAGMHAWHVQRSRSSSLSSGSAIAQMLELTRHSAARTCLCRKQGDLGFGHRWEARGQQQDKTWQHPWRESCSYIHQFQREPLIDTYSLNFCLAFWLDEYLNVEDGDKLRWYIIKVQSLGPLFRDPIGRPKSFKNRQLIV